MAHITAGGLANDLVIASIVSTALGVAGRLIYRSLKKRWIHEMNPNGGDSLRDFMNRTDDSFQAIATWQRGHDEYHEGYRQGKTGRAGG